MGKRMYVIERRGPWYYPRGIDDAKEELPFKKVANELIGHIMPTVYHMYMTRCHTVTVKELKYNPRESVARYFLKQDLAKLIKEDKLVPMVRIETDKGTVCCVQFIMDTETSVRAFVLLTHKDGGSYMNFHQFDLTRRSNEFEWPVFGGFFRGPHEPTLMKTIYAFVDNKGYDLGLMYIREVIDALLHDRCDERYPIHTKEELIMFKEAAQWKNVSELPMRRVIHRYFHDDVVDFVDYKPEQDYDHSVPTFINPKFNIKEVPEVAFSEKEWKFIDSYIEKNNYLGLNEMNLKPFVTYPRYGHMYRMTVELNEGGADTKELFFVIKPHDNDMDIYVIDRVTPNTSAYLRIKCRDIETFEIGKCFDDVEIAITNTDMLKAPKSIDEIDTRIIHFNKEFTYAFVTMIHNLLSMLIVMHDRPQRSRMVRCNTPMRKSSTSNKKRTEPEYHSVRLLKSVSDAKKLVQNSSDGPRSRADAVYTIEEWERVGHYRTLKSGKTVWIDATTCKRHLPLNETKEIKIKL